MSIDQLDIVQWLWRMILMKLKLSVPGHDLDIANNLVSTRYETPVKQETWLKKSTEILVTHDVDSDSFFQDALLRPLNERIVP